MHLLAIFSLVLLHVNYSSAELPGCSFSEDRSVVDCVGIDAATFANSTFERARFLTLRHVSGRVTLSKQIWPILTSFTLIGVAEFDVQVIDGSAITEMNVKDVALDDVRKICGVAENITSSLRSLSLISCRLTRLDACIHKIALKTLNVHGNQISDMSAPLNTSLQQLNASSNAFTELFELPPRITSLDISRSPLTSLEIVHSKLERLIADDLALQTINFELWNAPNLKNLSLKRLPKLIFISGKMTPSLESLFIEATHLTAFPQKFFQEPQNLRNLSLVMPFDCDECALVWAVYVRELITLPEKCTVPTMPTEPFVCISKSQPIEVRAPGGSSVHLTCNAYGTPPPRLDWWLYRPATFLGGFSQDGMVYHKPNTTANDTTDEKFTVLPGGVLLVHTVSRHVVERYICVASNENGKVHKEFHLRVLYDWYSLDLFNSVFWGAIATAVLVCAVSFLLNISWILTKKSILWWIQRAERHSRVRKMVEAMEKYRLRQMESLQARYTKRMSLIRSNYHQQIEHITTAYANQAERFRDYRQMQMESMASQLENIRDEMNQQMSRVREYGSRRAEQLLESYERQVNRMKAFSLHQRLKLLNQYKVKQRYMNKLLESFQDSHNPEALRKHEEEVRAALELPEVAEEGPLSRSSSFYSLPEYVIGDDGQLRPSSLTPSVRYTARDTRLELHRPFDSPQQ